MKKIKINLIKYLMKSNKKFNSENYSTNYLTINFDFDNALPQIRNFRHK